MSQYLQVRTWWRTGSKDERTLAATAAGTVLASTGMKRQGYLDTATGFQEPGMSLDRSS